MKIIITFLIAGFITSVAFGQVRQVTLKEGPMLKSIDWFINSSKDYIDTISKTSGSMFNNGLGIVRIRFFNLQDSMIIAPEANGEQMVSYKKRCSFIISMIPYNLLAERPPSFYFIRKNVYVLISTGLESHFDFTNMDGWNQLKKDHLRKVEKYRAVPGLKEYLITIDDLTQNNYMVKEYIGN